MIKDLHITRGNFVFQSRIIKETNSLLRSGLVDAVCIIGLNDFKNTLKSYEKIGENIEVYRLRLITRRLPKFFWVQLFKLFELYIRVFCYAYRNKINVVNVHSVDLLPLGAIIKFLCRAILVYDAHELETEKFGLHGYSQRIAKYIEKKLILFVDLTIVVSSSIENWYRREYGEIKIVTVLNCPPLEKVDGNSLLHDELNIPSDKKIIIYLGRLVRGRGVELLLDAFSGLNVCDHPYVIIFMGFGDLEKKIISYSEKHKNIYFRNGVSPSMVLSYAASADFGIAFIANESLCDFFCLPNKLFEYIMSGLPVIVNNVPEMGGLVRRYKIGVVLNSLTSETLLSAINKIERMNQMELSANLKKAASECSWERQSDKMIDAYRECLPNMFSDI